MKWKPKNKLAFICGVEFFIFFIAGLSILIFKVDEPLSAIFWPMLYGNFVGASTVLFVAWLMAHNGVIKLR